MNIISKHIYAALTAALVEEINFWRNSEFAKNLDESTFNPKIPSFCFFGQTQQQHTGIREYIGGVPRGYELSFYEPGMTPLEIWSAYWWEGEKEVVLNVFRYIKGETDELSPIVYDPKKCIEI